MNPSGAARNLVHDTHYRRARAVLARSVHRFDDLIARATRDRLQVLFEAATPMSGAVARPVLRVLAGDPRLELWVSSFDRSWDARAQAATPT